MSIMAGSTLFAAAAYINKVYTAFLPGDPFYMKNVRFCTKLLHVIILGLGCLDLSLTQGRNRFESGESISLCMLSQYAHKIDSTLQPKGCSQVITIPVRKIYFGRHSTPLKQSPSLCYTSLALQSSPVGLCIVSLHWLVRHGAT